MRILNFVVAGVICLTLSVSAHSQEPSWTDLYKRTVRLFEDGKYDEAKNVAQRALKLAEQTRGADHPDVATSLYWLGGISSVQGRHEEAVRYHNRALQIRLKALPPYHSEIIDSLHQIGREYAEQGYYAKAERYFREAVKRSEDALGPDHFQVSWSLEKLASLCRKTGRYEEAKSLQDRINRIRSRK